jgi:hypothetical protein
MFQSPHVGSSYKYYCFHIYFAQKFLKNYMTTQALLERVDSCVLWILIMLCLAQWILH